MSQSFHKSKEVQGFKQYKTFFLNFPHKQIFKIELNGLKTGNR